MGAWIRVGYPPTLCPRHPAVVGRQITSLFEECDLVNPTSTLVQGRSAQGACCVLCSSENSKHRRPSPLSVVGQGQRAPPSPHAEARYCEKARHPQALKGFQVSELKRKEMSFKLENLMGVRRLCDVLQPHSPGRGVHERCPPRTKEPVCPSPAGDGPALAHVRSPCGSPQVNPHFLYLKPLF